MSDEIKLDASSFFGKLSKLYKEWNKVILDPTFKNDFCQYGVTNQPLLVDSRPVWCLFGGDGQNQGRARKTRNFRFYVSINVNPSEDIHWLAGHLP